MLQLKYPEKTTAIKEMEERLANLSLAFKSTIEAELENPVLYDGKIVVKTMELIKKHVDQLEIEILASRNFAC
ncbi:MAG: hypothetical protein R2788_20275 [Saprospiraceae bacterium]